jgi:hypothetical protein
MNWVKVAQMEFCQKAMKLRVDLCQKLRTSREIQPISVAVRSKEVCDR